MKSGAVLAGENWITPAPVILSITVSDTPEGGGTDDDVGVLAQQAVGGLAAMSVEVSRVALDGVRICSPFTPPASLMSADGQVDAGELRWAEKASEPVSGSRVPTVNVPSPVFWAAAAAPSPAAVVVVLSPLDSSLPPSSSPSRRPRR